MSRHHSNKKTTEMKTLCCTHCKVRGEAKIVYESHNARDFKGRVCCPAILRNVCSKCSKVGHLPSYCVVTVPCVVTAACVVTVSRDGRTTETKDVVGKFVAKMKALTEPKTKEEPKAEPKPKAMGMYADLVMDSDDDESGSPRKQSLSKNVTVREAKKKPRAWADWSDDEDDF
jgi:hypothetical protein